MRESTTIILRRLVPAESGWRAAYQIDESEKFASLDSDEKATIQSVIGETQEFAVPLICWALAENWNGSRVSPGATGLIGIVATPTGTAMAPFAQPAILGDTAVFDAHFVRYYAPTEEPDVLDHGFVVEGGMREEEYTATEEESEAE